ncbi:MAG: hypothetical protein ABIR17_10080 [Pseudolysinimonas sp.]|uniref:hypothetical protein n=1 Tax=Pseudolysinimonas sp. TaxID=2680009 RepID=UPI003267FA58
MSRFDSANVAATAFAGGILLIALTGCTQIADLAHKQHREDFATYAAAAKGWVGVDIPPWIPADSRGIHNLATTDETVSVVRVTSPSELPSSCTLGARHGIPQLSADWSTEDWPDDVYACGDYEVMPMDGGWLGWFGATEVGQTPGG